MGVVVKDVKLYLSPVEQVLLRKYVEEFSKHIDETLSEDEVLIALLKLALHSEFTFDNGRLVYV